MSPPPIVSRAAVASVVLLALLATGGPRPARAGVAAAATPTGEPDPTAMPVAAPADSTDEARVEAVVRGLFDAMRRADSAAARSLFHPDARLSGPVSREGRTELRNTPVDAFVEAIGGAEAEWDERISDLRIRVDGDLATAWMDYVFYHGGERSHCGVNAFQLYRSPEGWKIFQVSDTRRREGCPGPAAARTGARR